MAYRRRTAWSSYNQDDERAARKVNVSITWDNVTNAAYRVKFDNTGNNWSKVEVIIGMIKSTIPSSQREYDPEIKTWFIGEAHIKHLVDACEAMPDFNTVFVAKPDEVRAQVMHTKEDDYKEFKRMLSFAHVQWDDTTDLSIAKKAYFRASMALHPDRAPDMADQMATLNVVWTRLKDSYFKAAEKQCQDSVT